MIKGVTLFDIHAPEDNKPCMRAIDEFLVDFKPDYLIWGGDVGNWESFSTWENGYHGENTENDFNAVNEIIDRHQSICGKKCKYIWLQGNHDEWVDKFCEQLINVKIKKEFNFKKRLRLKERNIKFIPINKAFKVGKLRFVHGIYLNEFHSKKTLLAYNTNVVYGHGHTEQAYTYVSPVDSSQVRVGRGRPCLCNLNPDYLKNRPNAWSHGLSVSYVRPNGDFNEYCVNITKGIFTFNDKTYDGNNQ